MSTSSYRKKPVVIQAVELLHPTNTDTVETPHWLVASIIKGTVVVNDDGSALIHTAEGVMRGNIGDYIIQGIKGELYPCKPDIFAATYDKVEEA